MRKLGSGGNLCTLWQFKLGWLANVYKWGKTVWKEIVVMENVLLQGIPRNAGHLIPTQPARSVQDNFRKKSCLWIVLSVLMLQFSPVNNSSRSARCDSSILHTELPFFKPLLLVSCHFDLLPSNPPWMHIDTYPFPRSSGPRTNQRRIKAPWSRHVRELGDQRWNLEVHLRSRCCEGEDCHGLPNELIIPSFL